MALRALGSFPPRGSAELKQVWLCSRLQRRLVRCLLTKLPSRADFLSKLSIALKEADETQYWLELLVESDIISKSQFESLNDNLTEIIAMLTASIKTTKNK